METNTALSSRDGRSDARVILRVSASILFKDAPPMRGKTVDIALNGIALLAPEQIAVGTTCCIRFNAMIRGQFTQIESVAKVIYCICVGTAGFRVGCQFTDMDAASRTTIGQIVNNRA